MEPPKPETKDKRGCTPLLIRIAIGVAMIFAIDFVVTKIFDSKYPHDIYTNPLIPFQNYYLAQTDTFVASEGVTSEFTNDVGVTGRFFVLLILPTACLVIVSIFLFIIPFTRNLLNYFWYAFGAIALIVLFQSFFVPPVMTIFDRERKVMTVIKSDWVFFKTKTEVPFDQITDFTYEVHIFGGFGHYDDAQYVDIFAVTPDGKIFLADNQIGSSKSIDDKAPLPKARQNEIDAAILALNLLVGRNPSAPPPGLLQSDK